jgi:hypothetical protein
VSSKRTITVICAPTKRAARRYARKHGLRRRDWVHASTLARILQAQRTKHVDLDGYRDAPHGDRTHHAALMQERWTNDHLDHIT